MGIRVAAYRRIPAFGFLFCLRRWVTLATASLLPEIPGQVPRHVVSEAGRGQATVPSIIGFAMTARQTSNAQRRGAEGGRPGSGAFWAWEHDRSCLSIQDRERHRKAAENVEKKNALLPIRGYESRAKLFGPRDEPRRSSDGSIEGVPGRVVVPKEVGEP